MAQQRCYETVQARFATGGFGYVDKVRDPESGHIWARKVVCTNADEVPAPTLRLLRKEAQILRALDHPNIVRLQEHAEDEDSSELRLILEYLPGGDCAALLEGALLHMQNAGSLSGAPVIAEPLVRDLLWQVVDALAYCHERGVVHRDVKPGNIVLTETVARPMHCKLVDFGCSWAPPTLDCADCSVSDRVIVVPPLCDVLGTPAYRAPEMLTMSPSYGPKVDVWSAGASAFELLVGQPPFGIERPEKKIRRFARSIDPGAELELLSSWGGTWEALSVEAQRFFRESLCADPGLRIAATQTREHSWFAASQKSKSHGESAEKTRESNAPGNGAGTFLARLQKMPTPMRSLASHHCRVDVKFD